MTKKKIFICFISLVCALAFIVGAVAVFSPQGSLYQKIFGSGNQSLFDEYYEYGETVTLPDHAVSGAVNVTATSVVTFPDGTKSTQKQFKLTQAGKYTVTYSAISGGQLFSDSYSFKVKYPIVTGVEKSTAYYGTSPYGDASDTPGLVIALDAMDTMVFSQVIDLRGSTKETFFVELFPTPSSPGSSDVEQFWITLTDVENPESYLVVRMNLYTEGTRQTMTLATRSNAQPEVIGVEWKETNITPKYIHVGNQYGSYPGVEMNGMTHGIYDRNGEILALRLSYEEATKALWSSNKWGMFTKIADLDDPEIVGESLWTGFTSGKVRMSFYCKGYMSDKANFVFKRVLGADFTAGGIDDQDAPVISVTQPTVAPAIGGEYEVPGFTVYDALSPVVKQEVKVLKGGMQLPVVDGKFSTSSAGAYSIIYTAVDSFGNESEQVVSVTASVAPTVNVSSVTLASSYNRGEKVILPTATVSGGRGENILNIYATKNGVKELLVDNAFIPMESGSYTITYEGEDEVGQKTVKDYAVSVVNGSQPVFRDEPVLPDYFISTFNYRDPVLYAYDYSSGTEKKIPASLTVSGPYGTTEVESGGGFTPLITQNLGEITLTWKAGQTTLTRTVKTIFARSSDGILTENYFVGSASVVKRSDYMEIVANGASDEWTFVNTLIADGFSIDFDAIPAYSNFDALQFTLTDAENPKVSITATLKSAENYRSTVTIGERKALLSNGLHEYSKSNKFKFVYNDGLLTIGSAKIIVDKTDNGEDFVGFPSDTVKLTVKFVGAESGSKYKVINLCGQQMGELYTDRVKPLVKVLGNYGGMSEVGATITVPKMISRDVLNPSVITYVTAKDTNGDFIKATDGTVLNKAPTTREYQFIATTYGQYQFEYVANDTLSGRDNKIPFVVTVFDAEAPKASFATPAPTTVKVGEKIIIPNIKVSDNISAKENIVISRCIVSATGKVYHLTGESNSIETMFVGTYQIRVLVYDEAGNITMLRQDVLVTE